MTQEQDIVNSIIKHLNIREINLRDQEGHTPLFLALSLDNVGLARALVDKGADVNLTYPPTGMTALHHAVIQPNVEEVTFLCNAGIDATLADAHGYNSLHMAVFRGQRLPAIRAKTASSSFYDLGSLQMARHLLHYDVSLVNREDKQGLTPLAYAAIHTQDPNLVRLLAAHGAELDKRYATHLTDYTLLHQAAQAGLESIILVLALEKADLDLTVLCNPINFHGCAWEGHTALSLAYHHSQWAAFKLLLDLGADPNAPDLQGQTLLHVALQDKTIANDRKLQAVELLLRSGGDPQAQDSQGVTPLKIAQDRRAKRVLEMMGGNAPGVGGHRSTSARALREYVEADVAADKEAENEKKVVTLLEEKDTCMARHRGLEQNMTAMMKEEAKLRGVVTLKQTHIDDLESLTESLRAELEDAKVKVEEGKGFHKSLQLSEERERQLIASRQKLEDRLLELMPAHDQAMNLSVKITELKMAAKWRDNMAKAKVESLKSAKAMLQAEVTNQKAVISELQTAQTQLEAVVKDREATITQLKEEVRVLIANHSQDAITHKDVERQLSKEVTSLEEQLAEAKAEHEECGESIRSIERRLEQKDDEIRAVYEHSAQTNLTCSQEKAALNEDLIDLRARSSECLVRKTELEKRIVELENKLDTSQQELMSQKGDQAKESLACKEAQLEWTEIKAKLESKLATCEAQHARCQKEMTFLEGRVTQAEALHSDCTKSRTQLDTAISQCTQALTDTNKKLSAVEEELKKSRTSREGADD